VTILLNLLAASVVGWFSETLSAVIALAVFLPVISGMSGSAGNQAIAVTMRELALGLIHPAELRWVATKEAVLACVNGLVLGLVLGLAAWIWKGNFYLGLLIGFAQAFSIFFAACFGGVLPLILKRLKIDPALASAPILTTLTDIFGFLLTLGLAAQFVPWLQ
jgi:magnesium transporter